MWAGGLGVPGHGRLCAIKGGRAQCSDPGEGVQSIYEDSKNALWVSTFKGLWRWKPQSPQFFPTGTTMTSALAEDKDGGLLFGRSTGIQRFVKGKSEVYPVAMLARQSGVDSFLWDHDGSLWVGSFSGLVHLHRGRAELFTAGRRPFCELGALCVRGSRGQYLGRHRGWARPFSRLFQSQPFPQRRVSPPDYPGRSWRLRMEAFGLARLID